MSNLFSILSTAGQTLNAFERLMSTSQNNVSNASTPGYARQDSVALALPYQASNNLAGGVQAGTAIDSRNQFAEQSVRNQTSSSGFYDQLSTTLAPLDGLFDVTGKSGVSGALNQLFQSFSAWSASPGSSSAQQAVLTAAQAVATSFQQVAGQVSQVRTGAESDLSTTVAQINQYAEQIQEYNKTKLSSTAPDPGLDANLHSTLESLAQLGNFVPLFQSDGSVTVLLGGQTPLVIGSDVNKVSLSYASAPNSSNPNALPLAEITDSEGRDITPNLTEGKLGALLQVRNQEIPSLVGDGQQAGSLNTLAKQVADRVNQLLTSGQTSDTPPQAGVPLFTYNSSSVTNVISTLAVNSTITPAKLAAADSSGSNGVALKLANLPQSTDPADQVNGSGILDYFSSIASNVGQQISDAGTSSDRVSGLLAQAKAFRTQLSGVSLDQEAVRLVELQRSYQAAARVVTVVNDMANTLLNM